MIFDSHFHLSALAPDWLPNQALAGGLAVTTQPNDWFLCLHRLSHLSDAWRLALGVHPWFADVVVDWSAFESLLGQDHRIVIGEVGLDGSHGHPSEFDQLAVFQRQLHYAYEYGRLLSLHCVNDREHCYRLIRTMRGLKGGFVHAFSGSLVQAQRWQALGFHLGIGPRLLTQLSDKRIQLLRSLDVSMIHLESDAPLVRSGYQLASPNDLLPYLTVLASVLDVSTESLSQQLYVNWCHLWRLNDE